MSTSGLRLLRGLVVGVVVAVAILQKIDDINQPNERPATPPETDPSFAEETSVLGRELLREVAVEGQTLGEHLERKYLGLYLIGRVGNRLDDAEIERLAKDLQHFHRQLDRTEDWALVSWYETIGVSQVLPLQKLLRVCPEVINLQMIDTSYIAHALGRTVSVSFDNAESDIETIKERYSLT
jgi:hypothetical protein